MSSHDRQVARVLLPLAGAAALYLGSALGIPTAGAHVHAGSDNAVRGAMAIVTFKVPNESNTGAATTGLTVSLPNVASAGTETMPGWAAQLDRDGASGTVRSVTWTAAPSGGIPTNQFALFRLSVQLPDTDTVSFPTTQTYSDGTVVKWDQPPLPGGGEPEHPAPVLKLAGAAGTPHSPSAAPADHAAAPAQPKPADNTARLLGGAALIVAALGLGVALIRRRA
jgi:uncharacterized protein YcnI